MRCPLCGCRPARARCALGRVRQRRRRADHHLHGSHRRATSGTAAPSRCTPRLSVTLAVHLALVRRPRLAARPVAGRRPPGPAWPPGASSGAGTSGPAATAAAQKLVAPVGRVVAVALLELEPGRLSRHRRAAEGRHHRVRVKGIAGRHSLQHFEQAMHLIETRPPRGWPTSAWSASRRSRASRPSSTCTSSRRTRCARGREYDLALAPQSVHEPAPFGVQRDRRVEDDSRAQGTGSRSA